MRTFLSQDPEARSFESGEKATEVIPVPVELNYTFSEHHKNPPTQPRWLKSGVQCMPSRSQLQGALVLRFTLPSDGVQRMAHLAAYSVGSGRTNYRRKPYGVIPTEQFTQSDPINIEPSKHSDP